MELRIEHETKKLTVTRHSEGQYYLGIEQIRPFQVTGLPFTDTTKLVERIFREIES